VEQAAIAVAPGESLGPAPEVLVLGERLPLDVLVAGEGVQGAQGDGRKGQQEGHPLPQTSGVCGHGAHPPDIESRHESRKSHKFILTL